MNFSSSFKYNSYRISLYENPFNNTKTNLKFLNGIDFQVKSQNSIVDIFINFTSGIINLEYPEDCKYLNVTQLTKFSSKFFLVSYDFLTLFKQEETFFNYILMNPFNNINEKKLITSINNSKNSTSQFLQMQSQEKSLIQKFNELKENNTILSQFIELLKNLGIFDFNDKFNSKFKEDIQLHFNVDKKEGLLKKVSFIYKGLNLVNLDVNVIIEEKNREYFIPQNKNCTILQFNNKTIQ